MKAKSYPLAILILLVVLFLFSQCADDDDDDSPTSSDEDDDDLGNDDDMDDDISDDDDDDDDDDNDDDNDSSDEKQLVYDDGQAESGFYALCGGCSIVQGFSPTFYPAVIKEMDYYVDSGNGIESEIRLSIYYESAKAGQPVEMIYQSLPFKADTANDWNSIDLSQVQNLQNYPIIEGKIWMGFSYETEGGNGPYIGYDYQGFPSDDIWYYSLFVDDWIQLSDYDYSGVLMIRPVLQKIPA